MAEGRVDELGELQRRLLRHASENVLRVDFFSHVMDTLLAYCPGSQASLWVRDNEGFTHWQVDARGKARARVARNTAAAQQDVDELAPATFDDLCQRVALARVPTGIGNRTNRGGVRHDAWPMAGKPRGRKKTRAVMVLPVRAEDRCLGAIGLCRAEPGGFSEADVACFEEVADAVAVALTHHRVQWALRERVKELSCLHGISRIADRLDFSQEEALQRIVELLPQGWQYPEISTAAIILDGAIVAGDRAQNGFARQAESVVVDGVARGSIELTYAEERPEFDEGPFLLEERSLIQAVARQVGALLELRQAEREKTDRMHQQLRLAARMATMGKLAAGAAHELNEPLGAVLGFAQLAKKHPSLPKEIERDLDRIVKASLHAREIIRQVMLFSRQTPPQVRRVALNGVIREALQLVRGRLSRRHIRVERQLDAKLPKIDADPGQLQQVVINLVVNAVQAMSEGGTLTIRTAKTERGATLTVADTGIGMSEEMTSQIFMPFFTTKDVGQGTGLGLSVVQGIVAAHGGTIDVRSTPGEGTHFDIFLPEHMPSARGATRSEGKRDGA